jgi:hypothetical protein
MPQTNLKTRSGNRAVVYFDGQKVGLIQNIRMSDDYAPDPASGIGDIHVQEFVPTMARHGLNVTAMVLIRGALSQAGAVIPENGDDVLQGLVFDIEVVDKSTNDMIKKYMGCSFASGDIEVTKHAIVMQSATFNALNTMGTGVGAV